MPKLYPGINPTVVGIGRLFVILITAVIFPFLLMAQPVISSFSPQSGPPGTTVTITGSNFGATPAANIVYFGAAKATVTAAGTGSLTVTVPTGASYLPISVTAGGLNAFSARPFGVTFSDPGQFTPQAFGTRYDQPTGATPAAVSAKDLDGDGKTDLAVISGKQILIYNNTGTLGFPAFTTLLTPYIPDATDYPLSIATGDLDGDGKPDIVVSMMGTPYLYVYLNTSTVGNITFGSPYPISASSNIPDLVIADFNADGKADIAVVSQSNFDATIYSNNSTIGTPSFALGQEITLTPNAYPMMLLATDLDGDGMVDLAITDFTYNMVYLFHNDGTRGGSFVLTQTPTGVSTGVPDINGIAPGPFGLAAGDLDGDGKPDIVAVNQYQSNLVLMRNTSTPGNISFTAESATPATASYPATIVINDLDGDGRPDICVAAQYLDSISVLRNTSSAGHISVADNVSYQTGSLAWWLDAADLDGDGVPDLAVVDNGSSAVSVMINKRSTDLAITAFTPTTGTNGTVVTITGINLSTATGVSFGGTPAASFTVVSPTTITATVAAGSSGFVTVTTPTSYATLNGFVYNIIPPTITAFSPSSADSNTIVLIEGTGFITNTVNNVSFGGTMAKSFTVNSDTEISAVVGGGASGNVSVTAPGFTVSRPGFTYLTSMPAGPPTISSFTPLSAAQGATITITGTNLSNITDVSFGGTDATFKVISDNQIRAIVASGATGDVTVTGSNGSGSYPGFTFLSAPPPAAPPRITSFTPQSAPSGTKITIKGINFSSTTNVTFGGVSAQSFVAVSDTLIYAIVGSGTSGSVRVLDQVGSDSIAGFSFIADVSSSTPTSGIFQLIQFEAAANNNQPRLSWQTRNDGGIAYYAVERGIDSNNFTVISTVPINTKTSSSHTYTYTDFSPRNGVNFYRIRIQDTTDHYSYSGTISVQAAGSTPLLAVYPNPVKYGFFLADLPVATKSSVFQLSDLNGTILQTIPLAAGVQQVRINVPGLPRGTYTLRWTDGTHTVSQSILIL